MMMKRYLALLLTFVLLVMAALSVQASSGDDQKSAAASNAVAAATQFPPMDAADEWGLAVHQPGAISQKQLVKELEAQKQNTANLQFVFPPDDRWRVSPAEASVAFIVSFYGDDAFLCSATFIGDRILITAAHCLYDHEYGGWPDGVAVVPGKDGDYDPYGFEGAAWLTVPSEYITEEFSTVYDLGAIALEGSSLGNTVGWRTLGVLTDNTLESSNLSPITVGYPGDKPFGTQWAAQESGLDIVVDYWFTSQLDQYFGQSGSAIMRGSDRAIFGIVSAGYIFDGQEVNVSLRITEPLIHLLASFCIDARCTFSYFYEESQPPPPPPPPPEPTPPSQPPSGSPDSNFLRTWERTDKPVKDGVVSRTWNWGDGPNTSMVIEPYAEAPGGYRSVQYYDKSRMEDYSWSGAAPPWDVSNGLLARELMTGQIQIGDNQFEQRPIAQVNVAGDANDPTGPTYASFTNTVSLPAQPAGTVLIQRINRAGQITNDPSLAGQGVTIGMVDDVTNHGIAGPFWNFMNSSGTVYESGQYVFDAMFENPYFATGRPISEPYWANVLVGGTPKLVLVQCFERRCLTFTPANEMQWQVEMGNIGQHYYVWRYPVQ